MHNAFFTPPVPKNEPIYAYAPHTPEREKLQAALKSLRAEEIEVPMYIGGEEVFTGNKRKMSPPHDHQHILGYFHQGTSAHVKQSIDVALGARKKWAALPFEQRASVFL